METTSACSKCQAHLTALHGTVVELQALLDAALQENQLLRSKIRSKPGDDEARTTVPPITELRSGLCAGVPEKSEPLSASNLLTVGTRAAAACAAAAVPVEVPAPASIPNPDPTPAPPHAGPPPAAMPPASSWMPPSESFSGEKWQADHKPQNPVPQNPVPENQQNEMHRQVSGKNQVLSHIADLEMEVRHLHAAVQSRIDEAAFWEMRAFEAEERGERRRILALEDAITQARVERSALLSAEAECKATLFAEVDEFRQQAQSQTELAIEAEYRAEQESRQVASLEDLVQKLSLHERRAHEAEQAHWHAQRHNSSLSEQVRKLEEHVEDHRSSAELAQHSEKHHSMRVVEEATHAQQAAQRLQAEEGVRQELSGRISQLEQQLQVVVRQEVGASNHGKMHERRHTHLEHHATKQQAQAEQEAALVEELEQRVAWHASEKAHAERLADRREATAIELRGMFLKEQERVSELANRVSLLQRALTDNCKSRQQGGNERAALQPTVYYTREVIPQNSVPRLGSPLPARHVAVYNLR